MPSALAFVVLFILLALLVALAVWARRIRKRIDPIDAKTPGRESKRFHFLFGSEPPGSSGGGGLPGP
jgi:hypothetical protein